MEKRYYEGCGREGPIRCIFLAEFHPIVGPKIACQFPEDFISTDLFSSISGYIIPKIKVQRCIMTLNALCHKIVGYPIRIDNSRYERNYYLFNLCFVCHNWSKTVQYEPVVQKLGEYLTQMEEEMRFVSSGSGRLPTMLAHLLHDLNTYRKATIMEGDTVMHLKVAEVRRDPPPVADHDVPVLVSSLGAPRPRALPPAAAARHPDHDDADADWDLTTRQLLPFINGYNLVSQIAADSHVEKTLAKSCIQNLVYLGVVSLIPPLKFSNMYRVTHDINRLFREPELQKACLAYIMRGRDPALPSVKLSDAMRLLCAQQQGTTLRTVCERYASSGKPWFDIRRLIVFALLHGLLQCLTRYPVYISKQARPTGITATPVTQRVLNGDHCSEELSRVARVDLPTLGQITEDDRKWRLESPDARLRPHG